MNDKRNQLLNDSLWKLMFKLSIPSIVGMLVIGLYTFVDAIFVGQWVGEDALGAIAVAYPFTLINNGIAVLVGIGSASVLSRAIGKKDDDTIKLIMGNLLLTVLILSLVVLILGMTFTEQLIALSGAEGNIFALATTYLRIIFIGSFFVNFSQSANMVIRGEGKMTVAMSIMAMGAILNIVLDVFTIKVMNLGIAGAAIATIAAQLIQAIATLYYFIKVSPSVKLKRIAFAPRLLPEIFSIGVSAMLMQVLSLVQQTLMYAVISRVGGQKSIILIGAVMRYLMLSFIPLWGISQGFQPLVGTNFGANQFNRVKDATRVFSIAAIAVGLLFWVPFMLFTENILSWFIKNPAIVSAGVSNARLAYIIFPLMGVSIILLTLFQAIGDAKKAGLIVLMKQLFLFAPILLIAAASPLKDTGVFLTMPLTDLIVLFITLYMIKQSFSKMSAPIAKSLK